MAEIVRNFFDKQVKVKRKHVVCGALAIFGFGVYEGKTDFHASSTAAVTIDGAVSGDGNQSYERVIDSEIARQMNADLTPYSTVNPEAAWQAAEQKGGSVYLGQQLSIADAMRYYYIAGFRGKDLEIMTAIAGKESNYYPGTVGDVHFNASQDRSIGLSQIYCQMVDGGVGCEGIRDWRTNFHPQANADHAFQLYSQAIGGNRHDNGLSSDGRFADWRNNPDGVISWLDEANEVYAQLSEQYGSLE